MDKQLLALALNHLGVQPTAYGNWKDSPFLAYDGEANEILIYGLIVPHSLVTLYREWLGDDSVISNQIFREKLGEIQGEATLRINSPGGDVWEMSGMVQAIQERGQSNKVSAIVDGVAASAASIVMAACSNVTIAKMGTVMIHRAAAYVYGNSPDLRKVADLLDGLDSQCVNIYRERMKASQGMVLEMMTEETWFTAEKAVKAGLADRTFEPEDKKAPVHQAAMAAIAKDRERRNAAFAALI